MDPHSSTGSGPLIAWVLFLAVFAGIGVAAHYGATWPW